MAETRGEELSFLHRVKAVVEYCLQDPRFKMPKEFHEFIRENEIALKRCKNLKQIGLCADSQLAQRFISPLRLEPIENIDTLTEHFPIVAMLIEIAKPTGDYPLLSLAAAQDDLRKLSFLKFIEEGRIKNSIYKSRSAQKLFLKRAITFRDLYSS